AKLFGIYSTGADSVEALRKQHELLALVQEHVTFSAYQAAFAEDVQRGKLEEYSAAAWKAAIANGDLSAQTLGAALRMEAMAGMAGYATEMILGIPANTPINFTSNAAVILDQIIALRAAAEAGFSKMGMTADAYERRLRQLQQQYLNAIQGT